MLERVQIAPTLRPPMPSRSDFYERFLHVRSTTRKLFEPLTEEDALLSVTPETSPPKWHLAHSTWFFEQFVLKRWLRNYRPFDPQYDYLFNSYYESLGSFLPKEKRGFISRPPVREVLEYRIHVDQRISALIHELPQRELRGLLEVIELGLNHEQQHQELLLMDIKQNFYENPLRPAYLREPFLTAESRPTLKNSEQWIGYDGGLTLIGAAEDGQFSYDNERGQHRVWIQPFELRTKLVTQGEYLEFIEAGGYRDPRWWLSDGWKHVQQSKATAPLYWEKGERAWSVMTLYGMRDLNPEDPVAHLSYYEATAFARWKGCRLPTEFEWELAARSNPIRGHFADQEYYHPTKSVTLFDSFNFHSTTGKGSHLEDQHGTLWEWTQSAYLPYPGYEPFENGLSEYNEKFMCHQIVLRGGSCVTPVSHYRPTYRNFYYPENRWQFSGLRLAREVRQ